LKGKRVTHAHRMSTSLGGEEVNSAKKPRTKRQRYTTAGIGTGEWAWKKGKNSDQGGETHQEGEKRISWKAGKNKLGDYWDLIQRGGNVK